LFIQEIQSDWGQEGRREGFGDGVTIEQDSNGFYRAYDRDGSIIELRKNGEVYVAMTTEAAVRDALKTSFVPKGISIAPFVTDTKAWVALSIKRMMRYAADNGFDKVAFINGQQAADLFNLRNQIDEVRAFKNDDGTFNIDAWNNGTAVLERQSLNDKELAATVGKELAEKIINESGDEVRGYDNGRSYSGGNLELGGEGMRAFYDNIVPQVANDVAKKVGGGKVEMLSLVDDVNQPTLTITPEMRETITTKPFTLFQSGYQGTSNETWQPDTNFIDDAKKYFGTTKRPLEAGYILPDGTMLDFTGRHETSKDNWASMTDERSVDHRMLTGENMSGFSLDSYFQSTNNNDIMHEFMAKTGAMRVDFGSSVFQVMRPATKAQLNVLEKNVNKDFAVTSYIDAVSGRIIDESEFEDFSESDITNFFEESQTKTVQEGAPLFQGEGLADKRGFIQFGKDRNFKITLLEKADLSTFLHETGHFYLEVLGDISALPTANDQLKNDYKAILDFVGLKSRDELSLDGKEVGSPEYLRAVEAHEKFARGHEAYLMEGKAPSEEMRSIFRRFGQWLKLIYREITNLNVELDDEIRGVFDRIYATDAEIEASKNELQFDALFKNAKDANMTDAEFEAYLSVVEQTTETGKEVLQLRLMRELMREKRAWWQQELQKVKQEVTEEVDALPVYQAFKELTDGEFKLNKDELVERYGVAFLNRLPRTFKRVYTLGEGMPLELAAKALNYPSGDLLIEDLASMRPRRELIDAEADRVMKERHGDIMTDGSISDEATIALHNVNRERTLATELRALSATKLPPSSAFRQAAQSLIGQTSIKDLQPQRYLNAQRKHSRTAFNAMAAGDYDKATDAKQKELLNHFLYLESTKAVERSTKISDYIQKFENKKTQQRIAKAGPAYMEQINAILDGYEFRRVPNKRIDRRGSLNAFVEQQEKDGEPVNIPISVLEDGRQINYRLLSLDELEAINEAVRNIENLARLKNKLTKIAENREISEVAREAIDAIKSNVKNAKKRKLETNLPGEKLGRWTEGFMLIHKKFSTIFRQMDGWKDGGYLWNLMVKPLNDSANYEAVQRAEVTKRLKEIFKPYTSENMFKKTYIPQLGQSMSLQGRLMVALNWGRAENRQRLTGGNGFHTTRY
jgi:hypothetical protein